MKAIELQNKIESLMQQYGIPYSVVSEFLSTSLVGQPMDDKYYFTEKEENGVIKMDFSCYDNSGSKEYNYTFEFDLKTQKASINCKKETKKGFKKIEEEYKTATVEHTSNGGWNDNPGYVVTFYKGNTSAYPENGTFSDERQERNIIYNESGIEFQEMCKNEYYPQREYKGDFEFGAKSNIRADKTYEIIYRREGLDKAVRWTTKKDITGRVEEQTKGYYHLSNEKGLGTMNFNLGEISEEEYNNIPNNYSQEEFEDCIKNDSDLTKEAFRELFFDTRTL